MSVCYVLYRRVANSNDFAKQPIPDDNYPALFEDNNANKPGDFVRPQWFTAVMRNWGLSDEFDLYKLFTFNPQRCVDDWAYEQNWDEMLQTAKEYLWKAEDFKDMFIPDEYGNDYNSVKLFLECVVATAEFVLYHDNPVQNHFFHNEFYICIT